ncbi:MAG: ABC transporter ATP-binding protein [Anaerolineae bacterium]|nr:ABC transporter ATP-binding protein [Anaerolineae bacterium]
MTDLLPTGHRRINELTMRGIVKRFPGVLAADHIDFEVKAGQIHALLGENGAGKSTLMKMLYGLYQPDEGQIFINGQLVQIRSPQDAIKQGIGMIHQHFMLIPSLTVAENVALGLKSSRGPRLDLEVVSKRILELSERYQLQVEPHIPVWQLAVGEQQRVEILRALYRGAALLILDEPTAVLTPQEVDGLFNILRQMAQDGHALIFISHKLHEVLAISHCITVLRDGRQVDTIPAEGATKRILAEMMVGRPVVLEYERVVCKPGAERLILKNVSALSNRGDLGLKNVDLSVCGGEIVGVAGVSGNGQRELAQAITGMRPLTEGEIFLEGQNITHKSPVILNQLGLSHIPQERMVEGVIKEFSVAENYILQDHGRKPFANSIFLNFRQIVNRTKEAIQDYDIKTPGHETPVKSLSGGNIQKLVLARELSRSPKVLIAAQPTRGVDIGATEYIHKRLLEERDKGTAILLISEDLDEIRALSDRIVVMYEGRIVGEVKNENVDLHQLGLMMAGVTA